MLMDILLLGASTGRMAGDIVLILLCVLLCVYLFAALLWPEKF
jgi:K+-transporting ATPase KdpF subunit